MGVHEAGDGPGLSMTDASGLNYALFVRDRFSVRSHVGIPRLDPPVDARPASVDVAEEAWDRWWTRLLEGDPSTPAQPDDEALARLLGEAEDDAARWEATHVDWPGSHSSMWVSQWLGENTLASTAHVYVVGAGGPWHQFVGADRALVSHRLFGDHAAMDAVLAELLQAGAVA